MKQQRSVLTSVFTLIALLGFSHVSFADAKQDAMAEMQKKFNAETAARPFDPGVASEIDAALDKLIKGGKKPTIVAAPAYWRPGYTCRNSWRYSRSAYYNCRYYYRYYGRYW